MLKSFIEPTVIYFQIDGIAEGGDGGSNGGPARGVRQAGASLRQQGSGIIRRSIYTRRYLF